MFARPVPTAVPPPSSTTMSSASISVFRITCAVLRRAGGRRERERLGLRLRLLHQTLERPVAAADHLGRHARERDDRTSEPVPANSNDVT